MTKRTLLIDADVVAYQAASSLEMATEWSPGYWTWNVCFDQVVDRALTMIDDIKEKLDADKAILCLTDPHHNFRVDVLPTYKTHRKTVRKPLVLMLLKDYLIEHHDAKVMPGLEGDDLMGILATMPHKGERVIVSIDKDMKTIPCNYVRTRAIVGDDGAELVGAYDVTVVDEETANANHMLQTLMGDATDGYAGCPGIGEQTARDIIANLTGKVQETRVLKSGPRKGTEVSSWVSQPFDNIWDAVVSHFTAAGLGEEEAMRQARVARILRASDYDLENKKVILWKPNSDCP